MISLLHKSALNLVVIGSITNIHMKKGMGVKIVKKDQAIKEQCK